MTLYKYLTADLKVILDTREVRFTQPEFFNDPFESFPFIQRLMTEDRFEEVLSSEFPGYITDEFIEENISTLKQSHPLLASYEKLSTENKRKLINRVKLQIADSISIVKTSFTESSNTEWFKLSKTIKERIDNTFGILCLSETNDNLIMWSHYADSHKGFLIGFDSNNNFFDQKLSQDDTIRILKPVIYNKKRSPLTLLKENISEEDAVEELISQFFLTKSTHWKAEKEWRMILPLKNASRVDKELYLFNVPSEAIREVVFGCKMQQTEKEEILDIIRKDKRFDHVKIKEASLSYDEYSLSIVDL